MKAIDGTTMSLYEQLKFDVDPVPGERVQELIQDYMNTPKPVVDRLSALIEADGE